ncbi:flagellar assembly protein FliW [Geomicrobium sp. JCM 19039]|uniref:flagellar assembly protein FliW n=1 Tax=Geomicrobium sp. JCM 19039 TaxID=1460636 RepID=UPI00045F124E|nr:flagellar assembly protein FliW [Geomicrobium sp. JCM 19039]GAK11638.1 flagellar assembly factor FliW [Geomicrobium sp. JCM 19039]
MKVSTKYFGEVESNLTEVIQFPYGLPGFEREKQFILLPFGTDTDSPFHVLQSITRAEVAFIVADVFQFFPEYEVEISESDVLALELENEYRTALWGLITIKEPFAESTMNLVAPVVINVDKKLAKQSFKDQTTYTRKERLFRQVKEG